MQTLTGRYRGTSFGSSPEDEMKGTEYPSIEAIDGALRSVRERLAHVFFHNFVGSEWVNTLCPDCGHPVIERFSLGCGGDMLKKIHGKDGRCPGCGRRIKLLLEAAPTANGEEEAS